MTESSVIRAILLPDGDALQGGSYGLVSSTRGAPATASTRRTIDRRTRTVVALLARFVLDKPTTARARRATGAACMRQ